VGQRDGSIPYGLATHFGSGLFPFSGGKADTALECGILRMDIKDGKVDFHHKLAFLTSIPSDGAGQGSMNAGLERNA